jgi:hypothetical protein
MQFGFGPRIRHPFFPGLTPTPAEEAKESCAALYGTYPELLRAAQAGVRVRRAVLVTRFEPEPGLSDRDRELLWELFEVPAFAMLLDRKGHVVAYECEAQSGLHVNPKYAAAGSATALCGCGRPGEKL